MHAPLIPTPDSADPENKDIKQNFTDMMAYTDKMVGKVIAHLDKRNLRENTIILFTGDKWHY